MYTRVSGEKPFPWAILVPAPWQSQILPPAGGSAAQDSPDVVTERTDEGSTVGVIIATLALPTKPVEHYFEIAQRHFAYLRKRGVWGTGSAVLGAKGGGVIADCRLNNAEINKMIRVVAMSLSARGGFLIITNGYAEGSQLIENVNVGAVRAIVGSATVGDSCKSSLALHASEVRFNLVAS